MAKTKRNYHTTPLDETKLPPEAEELEGAILGALMLEPSSIQTAIDILNVDSFYKEQNRLIYKSIVELYQEKRPVDILTVTNQLKKNGDLQTVGGPYEITMMTSRVTSSSNIEIYCRIVQEKFLLREIIKLSYELQYSAYQDDADPFDILDDIENKRKQLNELTGVGDKMDSFAQVLHEEFEAKKKDVAAEKGMSGVSTGNPDLDRVTSGFNDGDLVILAARPGMGKSTRLLTFAKEIAKQGHISIIFSLEMSKRQLVAKYITESSNTPLNQYRNGNLNHYDIQKIENTIRDLSKLNIYIFDRPAVKPSYIRKKIKDVKKRHPDKQVKLVGIDYLQLQRPDEKCNTRDEVVGSITRELKVIAKEEELPIIALSQLNRGVERDTQDAKRPKLSDLRESGNIEQDADVVMFIYRPSYYYPSYGTHPDEKYSPNNYQPSDYMVASEIIIAKNRNGVVGVTIDEKFLGEFSRFMPLNKENEYIIPPDIEPENNFNGLVFRDLEDSTTDSVPF